MRNKKIIDELRGIVDYLEEINADHLQQKTLRNAADLIESLTWVSVSERLPECDEKFGASKVVWCLDARGKTGFGIYQKQLRDEGWFVGGGAGENSVIITHWMPLPDPPVEETAIRNAGTD